MATHAIGRKLPTKIPEDSIQFSFVDFAKENLIRNVISKIISEYTLGKSHSNAQSVQRSSNRRPSCPST